MLYLILLAFIIIKTYLQCELGGYNSGVCISKITFDLNNLPFCGKHLTDYFCLNMGEEFNRNLSIIEKENQIKTYYLELLSTQLYDEYMNITTGNSFTINDLCAVSYKIFLCRMNFPSCSEDQTLGVSLNDCTALITNCGFNTEFCSISISSYVL